MHTGRAGSCCTSRCHWQACLGQWFEWNSLRWRDFFLPYSGCWCKVQEVLVTFTWSYWFVSKLVPVNQLFFFEHCGGGGRQEARARGGRGAGVRRRGGSQHGEAVRSFMASQDVGAARLCRAAAGRDPWCCQSWKNKQQIICRICRIICIIRRIIPYQIPEENVVLSAKWKVHIWNQLRKCYSS